MVVRQVLKWGCPVQCYFIMAPMRCCRNLSTIYANEPVVKLVLSDAPWLQTQHPIRATTLGEGFTTEPSLGGSSSKWGAQPGSISAAWELPTCPKNPQISKGWASNLVLAGPPGHSGALLKLPSASPFLSLSRLQVALLWSQTSPHFQWTEKSCELSLASGPLPCPAFWQPWMIQSCLPAFCTASGTRQSSWWLSPLCTHAGPGPPALHFPQLTSWTSRGPKAQPPSCQPSSPPMLKMTDL